jgi:hypothetical protein
MANSYRLKGYDPFSGDDYDIGGEFSTPEEAEAAAREELNELEAQQPTALSGGQDGIQDRVYILHPNRQYVRHR